MIKKPESCIDSYKLGHITMYPEGTEQIYCNLIPRSARHFAKSTGSAKAYTGGVVAFGARLAMMDIHETFEMNFFNVPEREVINRFRGIIKPFIGCNSDEVIVEAIRSLHKLGYLPIKVKWLPEGTVVPIGTPVVTVTSTDSKFAWLPGYLETYLSAEYWKRATASTIAKYYRTLCDIYAEMTCDDNLHVDFQCHDFSQRGMSTMEDAIKTGTGHLLFFKGSDSVGSADLINEMYLTEDLIACSVPATEHSVMCLGSANETEEETFRRLLKMYPKGIVSIVSDTWDFWNTITVTASNLKDEILSREADAYGLVKTVFRPDSGVPEDVICGLRVITSLSIEDNNLTNTYAYEVEDKLAYFDGSKYYRVHVSNDIDDYIEDLYIEDGETIPEWEVKGAVECLWDIFGGHENNKGYKVLNPKVGLIYGDSITIPRAKEIFRRLKEKGFASSNIVFGVGSYTYQYITRDTFGFALKATYAVIDNEGFNIAKAPKTDSGKNSALGRLRVDLIDGKYVTKQECTTSEEDGGLLQVGYYNGEFIEELPSFEEIRARARLNL